MSQAQAIPGGVVIGPSHNVDGTPGGGVHFITNTGRLLEEEGQEINIPLELRKSNQIFTFSGSNADILEQILKLAGISLADHVTHVRSGDVVICVRSAWDPTIRTYNGTIDEILHKVNTSNGCKPILKHVIAKKGGTIPKGVKPRIKDWQAEDPNSPRWKKKKERIQKLSHNIHRLRLNISRDMQSPDERIALTALIIAVMDRSAERIGNDDSADNGHFGVTGFRKKHITVVGNKSHLEYVGKSGTKHDKSISDLRIAKALKKAIKNSPGKFIFETSDGFRIKSDKVNRYLEPFNISAKDLRGYNANKWIIELLKKSDSKWQLVSDDVKKARKERKKIFNKAVKETADRVGHGAATLKKHYMIPELPNEYIENGRIIDMKNIGYYKDGGPLGDIPIQKYFVNKNEVPDIVNKETEKIYLQAEDEGLDNFFNSRMVKEVDWKDVVPTQDFLRSSKFNRLENVEDIYSIDLPWAIEYNGKYYINDGHHRAAAMHNRNQPLKLHVYTMAEGGTNEMFELSATKSVKNVSDNIDKIAFQYAHREMAYTQVESYLNENNNDFVKAFLSEKGIDNKEKLKTYVSNRQAIVRKGKGKSRREFLKSLEEDKTKGNVDSIVELALEQSAAMDKKIADSEISSDPVIQKLLSENSQEILALEYDDSEMLWDEESNRRFYVKRIEEDKFILEESGSLGNTYPSVLVLRSQLETNKSNIMKEGAEVLKTKFQLAKGKLAPEYAEALDKLRKVGSDLWKHKFKDEKKFQAAFLKLTEIYLDNVRLLNEQYQEGGSTEDTEEIVDSSENPVQEISNDLEENLQSEGINDETENTEPIIETESEELEPIKECICFSSYLQQEKPELVKRLISESVNSNPELRTQMDEAHMAWSGGKM